VRVKIVSLPDGSQRWKLEHDDVARLAAELGRDYLTLRQVLNEETAALLAEELNSSTPAGDPQS
jgi:hypothetical protein